MRDHAGWWYGPMTVLAGMVDTMGSRGKWERNLSAESQAFEAEPSIGPTAAAIRAARPDGWSYGARVKPVIDRLVAGLLLLLFLPLMFAVSVLIWLNMGLPIIYKQQRVGLNGAPFDFFKFRTMIPDRRRQNVPIDGPERRHVHKSPDDPRVPPLGKGLRSLRLDELPQFWNVVRGDMSLVGPRPEMPDIVERYEEWQHRRHTVKPGITGPWQISDHNGHLMHECTDIDLDYVDDVRFSRDMAILLRTPFAMFGRRGGY